MRASYVTIDIGLLREVVALDAATGALTWLERRSRHFPDVCERWNENYAGKPAIAAVDPLGYLNGHIFGKRVKAHRVVFALYHGRWPTMEIDHIDGNPSNNRPENLREVTRQQNNRNIRGKRRRAETHSRYKGVSWHRQRRKWVVQCKGDDGQHYRGLYEDEVEAARAYDFHARQQHGEYARVNFP